MTAERNIHLHPVVRFHCSSPLPCNEPVDKIDNQNAHHYCELVPRNQSAPDCGRSNFCYIHW